MLTVQAAAKLGGQSSRSFCWLPRCLTRPWMLQCVQRSNRENIGRFSFWDKSTCYVLVYTCRQHNSTNTHRYNWPRTQVHNMLRKYQQEANNIFMFLLIFFFFHQGYGHGSLKIYACHNTSWVLCSSIMFLEFCVQVQLYRYLTDLMIYVMFITLYLFYHSYIFIWINTRTA